VRGESSKNRMEVHRRDAEFAEKVIISAEKAEIYKPSFGTYKPTIRE
jgi:hypothetical protein